MLGHSHAISGAFAWAALAPTLPPIWLHTTLSAHDVIVGTALAAGAALIPDLDHHGGTIANALGPVTKVLTRFVERVSGGHRHATHSLLFAAAAGGGSWAGVHYLGRYFAVGVTFVLLALAGIALHLHPGGDGVRAWGPVVIAATLGTAMIDQWLPDEPVWLPWLVGFGCLVHLAGDFMTERGVPLLWPIKMRFEIPLISRTGNRVEVWVVSPLMSVGTVAALYVLTIAPR
ncbi:MAG: metal-dependent hydrolase [Actinobacteria bacterium]|nr:metal-dependent hydrolase [Actinomycetota bacterium]MBI3687699.1 metal-dependent hydrolase [Actinomycetota bacterium]